MKKKDFVTTRDKIEKMEEECEKKATSKGCEGCNCAECPLNKKFKDKVGLGLDDDVQPPTMEYFGWNT